MEKTSKVFFFIGIIIMGIFIYFGNYYKADGFVESILDSHNDILIIENNYGYYFDGSGKDAALIFYPGAKVEYTAYAKLMYDIALAGVDCFLVKMPLNFALFNYKIADDIIDNYEYKSWYLSGHSLGGVAASMYVNNNSDKINGIIFLASYAIKKIDSNVRILSIYGDRDGVLDKKSYDRYKANWNDTATEKVIKGANHSGFANYGEQKGDKRARISKNSQQIETTNTIIYFIEN